MLNQSQVAELAQPFVSMREVLEAFYSDPNNQKAYEEWYRKKFGKDLGKEANI